MTREQLNASSTKAAVVFSFVALMAVLSGFVQSPHADEGAGAHVFQLCMVALAPSILLALATADWKRPWASVRPLGLAVATLAVALGALYYLEHYR